MDSSEKEEVYSGLGTEDPRTGLLQRSTSGDAICPDRDLSQARQESNVTGQEYEESESQRAREVGVEEEAVTPRGIEDVSKRTGSGIREERQTRGMIEKSQVVREYVNEIDFLVEEVKGYVRRTLMTKDNRHEKYLMPRLERITAVRMKWEEESERMRRYEWVEDKIDNIEKGMEKMGQEQQLALRSMEESDLSRRRETEKIEKSLRMELRKCRDDFDEKFKDMKLMFADVKEAMDALNGNMGLLKEKVKEMPWNKIDEVRIGIDKLGKVDISEDLKKIGNEIKVVRECTEVATKALEVDRLHKRDKSLETVKSERTGDWVSVVKGKRKRHQVIVEFPKEGERKRKEDLIECLDKKSGKIRVINMRRQGRNMVVELHDKSDVEELRMSAKVKEAGFKIDGEPRLRKPRVIIRGIDKDITRDELINAVESRNPELFSGIEKDNWKEAFIPEIELAKRHPVTRAWVVKVNELLFARMLKKRRVYVGVWACRVDEFVTPIRCYRCQDLGHHQRRCGRAVTCINCGEEGHRGDNCQKELGCANCKRYNLKDVKHSTLWEGCPIMVREKAAIRKSTSYEVKDERNERTEVTEDTSEKRNAQA